MDGTDNVNKPTKIVRFTVDSLSSNDNIDNDNIVSDDNYSESNFSIKPDFERESSVDYINYESDNNIFYRFIQPAFFGGKCHDMTFDGNFNCGTEQGGILLTHGLHPIFHHRMIAATM